MPKGRKRLKRERTRTDKSLTAERLATDRSISSRGKSTQRAADDARRQIRNEADRRLLHERKAADAERSRRSSSKGISRDLEIERQWAAQSLRRERKRADRGVARARRRFDSTLREERSQRRETEKKLFSRERGRTDRNLGDERGRTDVTFRVAERRLALARTTGDKAAAAVLLRDEFMAIISHDLRTPLNVIAINAARLAKMVPVGEGVDQIRKMCVQIEEATGRIGRMVDDLLDAERMALANLRVPARPGDIRDPAREAIELITPLV